MTMKTMTTTVVNVAGFDDAVSIARRVFDKGDLAEKVLTSMYQDGAAGAASEALRNAGHPDTPETHVVALIARNVAFLGWAHAKGIIG